MTRIDPETSALYDELTRVVAEAKSKFPAVSRSSDFVQGFTVGFMVHIATDPNSELARRLQCSSLSLSDLVTAINDGITDADTDSKLSACCRATISVDECGTLYCKACFEAV